MAPSRAPCAPGWRHIPCDFPRRRLHHPRGRGAAAPLPGDHAAGAGAKLLAPQGLTPEATIGSRLSTDTQPEGFHFVRAG